MMSAKENVRQITRTRHQPCALAIIIGAMLCVATRAADLADDPEGRAMVQAAQRAIAAYQERASLSTGVLRVVYFHPNDREPLPEYAARLDRLVTNVSEFFRDGLRRFGVKSDGLPLERCDGHILVHVVRGRHPTGAYHYTSGDETAAEIREALRGKIDFDREHVLVLYALCRKEPDGRYVFDAPYYGIGSQQAGVAHAADCELLDPRLLNETDKEIVYTEHYYPRLVQTFAKFNTWYIGGIAHELGHGLGIMDHDAGSPAEQAFGTSLMGWGNHTFRQEVWGGGAPTYMSRASALQLVSHPLFTGRSRGRWDARAEAFENFDFSTAGSSLHIKGTVSGKAPPYAVVAHVWPTRNDTDHCAITFPALVNDGAFAIELRGLGPDTYHLQLVSLQANGGTMSRGFRLAFDQSGKPDAAALTNDWIIGRVEAAVLRRQRNARSLLGEDEITRAPTPEIQRKLRILRAAIDPAPPTKLATVTDNQVFLSDVAWVDARVGWGKVARNHYWFDDNIQNGVFLSLRGEVYAKGLYAHSPSRYVFELDGKWRSFTATIGLRDGAQPQGSAIFSVRGDGRELYRSPILRPESCEKIKVDVAGVKQLELGAVGGESHNHFSWAIWVDPRLER